MATLTNKEILCEKLGGEQMKDRRVEGVWEESKGQE